MPATQAMIGHGSTFGIYNGSTYDEVAEVVSITPFGYSRDAVDATHMQSEDTHREFIAGLLNAGSGSIEINYLPVYTDVIIAAMIAGKKLFRITFPNATTFTFYAIITGYSPEAPLDGKMSASFEYQITGKPVFAAGAAPANSVLPAISGTPQVGQTLTAFPGVWTQAATFTYVWKNEGVAIDGATASTYELQAGDQGDNITLTVTATNAAGSASATSAETTAVAAA